MAELAARGHRVAGLDLSEPMLDFARKRFAGRGVNGKLLKAPMQEFDLHSFAKPASGFDVAHILVSSFKYLLTEDDAAAALRCICDHLRPGGVFVLGLHLTEYDDDQSSLERWRAQRDGLDVICTIKSEPADRKHRLEKVRSRIVVRPLDSTGTSPGTPEPKRYETNWQFRAYNEAQLESLLKKEPRFKHVATYTFHHNIAQPTVFGGEDLGLVLVLRKDN
jgi:SAM-dependent methyltransferase